MYNLSGSYHKPILPNTSSRPVGASTYKGISSLIMSCSHAFSSESNNHSPLERLYSLPTGVPSGVTKTPPTKLLVPPVAASLPCPSCQLEFAWFHESSLSMLYTSPRLSQLACISWNGETSTKLCSAVPSPKLSCGLGNS